MCLMPDFLDNELSVFMQRLRMQGVSGEPALPAVLAVEEPVLRKNSMEPQDRAFSRFPPTNNNLDRHVASPHATRAFFLVCPRRRSPMTAFVVDGKRRWNTTVVCK